VECSTSLNDLNQPIFKPFSLLSAEGGFEQDTGIGHSLTQLTQSTGVFARHHHGHVEHGAGLGAAALADDHHDHVLRRLALLHLWRHGHQGHVLQRSPDARAIQLSSGFEQEWV
jgi:hypothetical protein